METMPQARGLCQRHGDHAKGMGTMPKARAALLVMLHMHFHDVYYNDLKSQAGGVLSNMLNFLAI